MKSEDVKALVSHRLENGKWLKTMWKTDPSSSDRAGLPSSLQLRRDKMPRLKMRNAELKRILKSGKGEGKGQAPAARKNQLNYSD